MALTNPFPARRAFTYFILPVVALSVLGFVLSELSAWLISSPADAIHESDAMVVLGGEYSARPAVAAHLYRQQLAPKIIVSGRGDGRIISAKLAEQGVPVNDITWEQASASTYENARNTVPLLHAIGARRVMLVTSWFHARRAKACFKHFAPEIEFTLVCSQEGREHNVATRQTRLELRKIGFYWLRYGILSF